MMFERLEPCELSKVSRTVLRGGRFRKELSLPDYALEQCTITHLLELEQR